VGQPVPSAPAEAADWRSGWLLMAVSVIGLLGVSLWLIMVSLERPFVYDDVSFVLGARAVAATGWPYGNQGYLLHLYWLREQWALWHPPLYIYLLGATVALFGDGERAARSLGVLSLLICSGLAFDLARRMVNEHGGGNVRAAVAGVIAVALLVLNPLAIQATAVLDIDNTILMVLVATIVWVALRLPDRWSVRIVVGLALLFALSLWAKMTTPLAVGVALVFVRLFQRTGWRGAVEAATVAALGVVIFAVTWVGISRVLGLPIDYTLDVVRNEAIESSASSRDRLVSVAAFVSGVAPAILWIGPFFCLLFVASGLRALGNLLRGRGLRASDLLVVLGAAIYLAYVFKLAGNFPKYHATMLPLWSAASAALVARLAGRPNPLQLGIVVLGGVWLLIRLMPRMATFWDIQFEPTLNRTLILGPGLIGLGIAALWVLLGYRSIRSALLGALPVALLAVTLAWNVALDLAQRDRTGSTTYYYGRNGQQAAAEALDSILRPDETYVASKEVAWYARNQQYVDQESWQYVVWDLDHAQFDGTYLGHDIRVLALEVGEQSFRWAYDGLLLPRGYTYAGEYGNFLIYVRK
jgi:4-amino-4-deoxy-L-arabinose transferase-like glycosyltransferase